MFGFEHVCIFSKITAYGFEHIYSHPPKKAKNQKNIYIYKPQKVTSTCISSLNNTLKSDSSLQQSQI